MAYNRSHARALLTDDELALFNASLADAIGALTPAELKRHLDRARRARDKYRDLFQRQRIETRERSGTKSGKSGVANQRTEQKAKLLDEALGRFQKHLDLLAEREAAAQRRASAKNAARVRAAQAGKAAPAKAKPARARATEPEAAGGPPRVARSSKARAPMPEDTPGKPPAAKRQMGKARSATVKGSISAAGRRAQAKRDQR